MTNEIVFHHGTIMVRRLRLAPGEAMRWHRDPFRRVAVVLSGDMLSIEFHDGGERQRIEVRRVRSNGRNRLTVFIER